MDARPPHSKGVRRVAGDVRQRARLLPQRFGPRSPGFGMVAIRRGGYGDGGGGKLHTGPQSPGARGASIATR